MDNYWFRVAFDGGDISYDQWNWFYPVFITLIKNMTEEAKYIKSLFAHNFNQNL